MYMIYELNLTFRIDSDFASTGNVFILTPQMQVSSGMIFKKNENFDVLILLFFPISRFGRRCRCCSNLT